MTVYKTRSEIDINEWEELVRVSPNASFFQTPECHDFYVSLSFLDPFLVAVSENGRISGLICGYVIADGNLLKQFFSRRAIVPGGALLAVDISDEALAALLEGVKNLLKHKAIYIEFRNFNDYSAYRDRFEQVGFQYQPHLNFHVETSDLETCSKQLSSTKRRDVKLSRKGKADWLETSTIEDIIAYYDLLSSLYKVKVKTSLFPVDFFIQLIQQKVGKLFIIKYENQIIGGSVCVLMRNQTVYEWFVCGMDGKFKNIYPSTMATWAAIEYAATNGYKRFDMMGAGKPDESYGVREFKSKFGGKLVEHGRFLFVCQPLLYMLGKKVVEILKKE